MARIRINTRNHTKEKPYLIKSYFFSSKLVMQKKSIGWAEYVHVCEWDICWRNFCDFPWWLKNEKSRSKIALFSNERHFEIWFPKKKTITFFWSKLSKLHKKDPILHVATTFSPKTRGNKNMPWTHSTPLKYCYQRRACIFFNGYYKIKRSHTLLTGKSNFSLSVGYIGLKLSITLKGVGPLLVLFSLVLGET